MTSRPVLALMLATLLGTGASLAAPGDPFGGDDAGCFPLNKNAAKCQHAVAKAASKALVCILGCHIKRANGKLVDDTAEDACESTDAAKSCKAKYDKATGPNSKVNALCPPCLDATARATVFATIESQLDNGTNAAVYCAPGTPFGGDDQGNVPASKSNDQKCEDAVAKALAKASACILTCGTKLADGKLADDAAEDACETGPAKSCKVKYDGVTGPTSKINALCPACLDATARANAFANAETQLDALGGLVYCCEPSTTSTTNITTTTTSTTTTSTTCPPPTGQVLKGSLTATVGRFNYNVQLGLPGANSACSSNFPGTHACTYPELQAAAAACDLPGLKDTANMTVTSFWAIASDASTVPNLQQCLDDAVGGSNKNWEYGTAHTASRGQKVDLDNTFGTLGPLQSGLQCNFSGNSWVGCCQ
ncbi:MAG: hypothetical protein E6J55_22850 [Deltaproteobacteria bacterium]|nr:MAG: hypothetical protein E6J55_22850 [Deltaproteobacteria bacterium]